METLILEMYTALFEKDTEFLKKWKTYEKTKRVNEKIRTKKKRAVSKNITAHGNYS